MGVADDAHLARQLHAARCTLQTHLSILRAGTDEPLLADQTIEVTLTVSQTAAHTVKVAWLGLKEIITVLGAAGVSLVAVVAYLVRRARRRTR